MKRLLIAAATALGAIGVACYQDDALQPLQIAPTRVLLTDDPFPFDGVGSVNIYVTRIDATAHFDTLGAGEWVEIAAPRKRFDLLTLQQGATAFVGEGPLDPGQYQAIRMTINIDSSSIRYVNGAEASVNWNSPGYSEIVMHALVEEPLAVSPTGAEIVIDFDVGRSFPYNLFGTNEFTFIPWLRAVNSAATGAIEGTVTRGDVGGGQTVQNANVTVYAAESFSPYVVATGRTDAAGHYKVAFLRAGQYTVRFEQPDIPALGPNEVPIVPVTVGTVTTLSVVLPRAGAGGAYIRITGPTTVGVGGGIELQAAVGDSSGDTISNPSITWFSRDTAIAAVFDSAPYVVRVFGRAQGGTWIVATSGGLSDSVPIEVVAQVIPNPVASVTVTPPSLNLVVGDSANLYAELRDSAGNVLINRPVSWFPADSSGVVDWLVTVGSTAVLKARQSGSTTIRAVSEGRTGSAIVTVQ